MTKSITMTLPHYCMQIDNLIRSYIYYIYIYSQGSPIACHVFKFQYMYKKYEEQFPHLNKFDSTIFNVSLIQCRDDNRVHISFRYISDY